MYLGQLRKMIGKLNDVEDYTADIEHEMLEEAERIERMLERRGEHIHDQDQKINALTNRIKEIQQDFGKLSDQNEILRERINQETTARQDRENDLNFVKSVNARLRKESERLIEQNKALKQDQYSESW